MVEIIGGLVILALLGIIVVGLIFLAFLLFDIIFDRADDVTDYLGDKRDDFLRSYYNVRFGRYRADNLERYLELRTKSPNGYRWNKGREEGIREFMGFGSYVESPKRLMKKVVREAGERERRKKWDEEVERLK